MPSLRLRFSSLLGAALWVGVALALSLAAPAPSALAAASLESGRAFSELAKEQQEAPTATTATTASTTSTTEPSNSHTVIFIALGAAVLVLSAIAVVIARDARRMAPAGDSEAIERGYERHSPARLAKRRAKAKAARQQRKRNR